MAATCCEISSVARKVWLASVFLSRDHRKAPPVSPARAASMVALSANRFVCAIAEMAADHQCRALGGVVERADDSWVRSASATADTAFISSRRWCWRSGESIPTAPRWRLGRRHALRWSRPGRRCRCHAFERVVGHLIPGGAAGRRQRGGRFLDRLGHFADGAGQKSVIASSMALRRAALACSAAWRWRHRICDVEADDLRDDAATCSATLAAEYRVLPRPAHRARP